MTVALATSADGQWAVVRIGRTLSVVERPPSEEPAASVELSSEDVDLAVVMPGGVLVVERSPARVLLLSLPDLQVAAAIEIELASPPRIVAATGSRVVLGGDGPSFVIIRVAHRALAAQAIEPGVADFAAGMDRHQVVFGLAKKVEVWDAVSARPMLKLSLQLPPPPRAVGTALGHLFVTRPGSDEIYVYRLSDGRPFRHQAGAKIERAIGHPGSGIVVLVTARGLMRINCFAHSLTLIDTPYTGGTALAIHGTGDAVTLLGVSDAGELWRVSLEAAHGAPSAASEPVTVAPAAPLPSIRVASAPPPLPTVSWRKAAADAARARLRGEAAGLTVPDDSELAQLATRLRLGIPAQRALALLYALYLIGEVLPIAQLAELLEDWSEPLGQGELAQLALLRRRADGRVRLRHVAANLLDGAPPHAVRIAGTSPTGSRPGAFKLVRRGRTDAAIETSLVQQMGKLAVIEGDALGGLLEARLHDAVALFHLAPVSRPAPWPRDASAVIVVDDGSPRWVTELPAYDAV